VISYWITTGTTPAEFLSGDDRVTISSPREGDLLIVFRHKDVSTRYLIKKGTKKPGLVMIGKDSQ
jgi:hypothetical protein